MSIRAEKLEAFAARLEYVKSKMPPEPVNLETKVREEVMSSLNSIAERSETRTPFITRPPTAVLHEGTSSNVSKLEKTGMGSTVNTIHFRCSSGKNLIQQGHSHKQIQSMVGSLHRRAQSSISIGRSVSTQFRVTVPAHKPTASKPHSLVGAAEEPQPPTRLGSSHKSASGSRIRAEKFILRELQKLSQITTQIGSSSALPKSEERERITTRPNTDYHSGERSQETLARTTGAFPQMRSHASLQAPLKKHRSRPYLMFNQAADRKGHT